MAASDPSYFADFEHAKIFSSHFADCEQVKKLVVILKTLNNNYRFINFLIIVLYLFLYYIKKRVKHFYSNNLGIHRVIKHFTVCLCIIKMKKSNFLAYIYCLLLFVYYSI